MTRSSANLLVSNWCKFPDHSFVKLQYNTNIVTNHATVHNAANSDNCSNDSLRSDDIYTKFSSERKVFYDDIPESFLTSAEWRSKMQTWLTNIDEYLLVFTNQNVIDKLYDEFCTALFFAKLTKILELKTHPRKVEKSSNITSLFGMKI